MKPINYLRICAAYVRSYLLLSVVSNQFYCQIKVHVIEIPRHIGTVDALWYLHVLQAIIWLINCLMNNSICWTDVYI